jgi:hypothetical protein
MSKDAIVSHLSYFTDGRRKPFAVRTTRLLGPRRPFLGGKRKARRGSDGASLGPPPKVRRVSPGIGRLVDFW